MNPEQDGLNQEPEMGVRCRQKGEEQMDGAVTERKPGENECRGNEAAKGGEQSMFSWEHGWSVEPWAEPVDGGVMLDGLVAVLNRYVVLGRFAAETLALWVLHTYGFHLRDVTTYIGLESPQKRCGKTTLLTVLSELVNRPVVASNISSPAFFRVIEEKRPTLMIDEADTVLHRNDELRGILNAGYKRKTAYVVRVASEVREWGIRQRGKVTGAGAAEAGRSGGTRLVRFSCWCPKVIATIKHLPETLADRCIVIGMQRKTAKETCARLKGLDGTELRRKCTRFVLDHSQEIARAEPELPADLNDRAADIWEPLLALADLAGGEWPGRARAAAAGLTAAAQQEAPIGALLFDIMICFLSENAQRLFSRSLVGELNRLGDRPWAELRRGKEISEQWLSRQLRPYGVRPRTMWIGETAAKGYLKDDFQEVFGRYISKTQAKALLEELRALAERPKASGVAQASSLL